jgi:hypothetical protein
MRTLGNGLNPRLIETAIPEDPRGVVLVLHGGASRPGRMEVSPAQLSVLRMVPIAGRIGRAGRGRLAVFRLLGPGAVPITVTTNAGSGTSSQPFTYQARATAGPMPSTVGPTPILDPAKACTIPKLAGKTLKAAKAKVKGAGCKLGRVTRKKGATARSGEVVGQDKKPGARLPAGTVVKVTLGKG